MLDMSTDSSCIFFVYSGWSLTLTNAITRARLCVAEASPPPSCPSLIPDYEPLLQFLTPHSVIGYSYDSLARQTETTLHSQPSTLHTSYAYDAVGNLTHSYGGTKMSELIEALHNGCCDYEITFETLESY